MWSWSRICSALLSFNSVKVKSERARTDSITMANPSLPSSSSLLPLVISLLLLFSFASPSLAKKKPSPRPITDTEIREKKNACYADIESGMWGSKCRSSTIDKENCALHCLSPQCYDHVYGGDPLEEGERDYIRSQEYKYCMHKLSMGESLEGIKGAFDY